MNEAATQAVAGPDERRSAQIPASWVEIPSYARPALSFALVRLLLRSPAARQDLPFKGKIPGISHDQKPAIMLDGEMHRRRRASLARLFSPKAIKDHHLVVREATTAALIADLRRTGRGQIDLMSMRHACDVAVAIVGLTESDPAAMAGRIRLTFESSATDGWPLIGPAIGKAKTIYKSFSLLWLDVKPAIRARKANPQADIISLCLEIGYSDEAILVECVIYGTAGMLTTREFIVMVAWYLLDRPDLREAFLGADVAGQIRMLEEVLRLEPVAALLYRRAEEDMEGPDGATIRAGERFALDIRAANTDEAATGACPYTFDAERGRREKSTGGWLSFGDGAHGCPGAQVALAETRVLIVALLRVPGIRLERPPVVGCCDPIGGYELHGAIVTCERG
ncbi:MAG: cytochrome P450 [Alphaproteobacteria bacterium]|nr:cytochrome P450 [Alphaproteobacteria bacterium]